MDKAGDKRAKDIDIILKRELKERQNRNPHYSLRAFAQNLGISDSYLSRLIRRKQIISPGLLRKIAGPLRLGKTHVDEFDKTLQLKRKRRSRKRRQEKIRDLENL